MKEQNFKIPSHFWLHSRTPIEKSGNTSQKKKKKKKKKKNEKMWQLEKF
jgi:hypothetical protein